MVSEALNSEEKSDALKEESSNEVSNFAYPMKAVTNLEDAKALVKVLAASSPYVITDLTCDKASIKFPPKRIMF